MQDIHSIATGGDGRSLFSGNGGDRRFRNHHHRNYQQGNDPNALKCPRCDSSNTKFCYYNNYNLSQPRYFCKTCRRYWTKGGVLRNVPVGGGCRKKKRSKHKSRNRNRCSEAERKPTNSHNASSDGSTAANTTAVTESDVTSGIISTNSAPTLLRFPEASRNPSFDPTLVEHNLFSEIDALSSLMTSSTDRLPLETSTFGFIDDDTPLIEISGLPEKTEGGVGTEDWKSCTDEALFDLTGTVDQSYWNQIQWDQ